MYRLLNLGILFALSAHVFGAEPTPASRSEVKSLKITVLSTMLADGKELGEWGFAALVEVDGHRILFDTGAHPDVVLRNAQSLNLDLTTVPDVVLSHSHWDHTGGFIPLRQSVMAKAPNALARTYAGLGIFYPRAEAPNTPMTNRMLAIKSEYESTGGVVVVCEKPLQLFPGVWLTGPVPRKYPERNWSGSAEISTPAGRWKTIFPKTCRWSATRSAAWLC